MFDFVPQGVQSYVAGRNRTQKKRILKILRKNPLGFYLLFSENLAYYSIKRLISYIRFFVPDGFSDDDLWGEMKEMQKRRNTTRRRTIVRQRRVSAVEKAKTFNLVQESDRIPTP